jgi:hypothetical protein
VVGDLVEVGDHTDVERTQAQLQETTAAETRDTSSVGKEPHQEDHYPMLSCIVSGTAQGQAVMPTTIAASWNSKLLVVGMGQAGRLPSPSCPVVSCACARVP